MEENKYTAKEDAYRKLGELVEESWMDISEERCRSLTPAVAPLLEAVVDATRITYFMYTDHVDAYTLAHSLKGIVDSIYVDSVYI